MRLGSFCQRQAASPPSGLPALAFPPLRGGPLPLQARVLTAPKQRRRLQTLRPSGPSPCSCPVVDTPAAASRQPLPSGTVFAVFSPAGGFFPPSGTVFTDFGPVGGFFPPSGPIFADFCPAGGPFLPSGPFFAVFSPAGGPFLQLGTVFAFFSPNRPVGQGHFAGSVADWRRTYRSAKLTT